jgi:hypothetical protein
MLSQLGITRTSSSRWIPPRNRRSKKILDLIKKQAENGGDKRTGLITDKSA